MVYPILNSTKLAIADKTLNSLPKFCDFFKAIIGLKLGIGGVFPETIEMVVLDPHTIHTLYGLISNTFINTLSLEFAETGTSILVENIINAYKESIV
jgi:hypothetical protein